jgi:NADH-quinone oxidoreductase subunit H
MLGEYVAITTMYAMAGILFMGGWQRPSRCCPSPRCPGVIWFVLVFFMFAMSKAIVPR